MFSSFSASMNFFGKKKHKGLRSELSPDMTVTGAYRISRDDSFGYNNSFVSEPMIQQMRPTKSSNDLTKVKNVPLNPANLRQNAVEVSRDPRGAMQDDPRISAQNMKLTKKQEKEQKKLEKQLLAEQKAKERQTRKEQAKQEKLAKITEQSTSRQERKEEKREKQPDKKKKKAAAPQPPAATATHSPQYPTNTLDSSISKSSGPPPYSAVPQLQAESAISDASGNVVYTKPVDNGSWDMISAHRKQIKSTTVIGGDIKNKPIVMDLNYRFQTSGQGSSNSEA